MNSREKKISDVIDLCYVLADDAPDNSSAERWRDLAQLALQNGRIDRMDFDGRECMQ